MKNEFTIHFLCMAFSALLFAACQKSVERQIVGTYVNHAASEFSIAKDTLIVKYDKDNRYLIHRKTGFRLIDEKGKAGKKLLESEVWEAVYDSELGVLIERCKGRTISLDVEKEILRLENSAFRRIN